jgi:hypothetical protein
VIKILKVILGLSLIGLSACGSVAISPKNTVPPTPVPRSVMQGALFSVSGSGYAANTTVTLTLHSAVVIIIGSTVSDAKGAFSAVFGMPKNAPLGVHKLYAEGLDPSGASHRLISLLSVMGLSNRIGATSSISGNVYNTTTSLPLTGICVKAYRSGQSSMVGEYSTDSLGRYRIENLQPGPYVVQFSDCGHGVYKTEYYPAAASQSAAQVLQLVRGAEQIDINIGLMRR